jgi:hypothetical protein
MTSPSPTPTRPASRDGAALFDAIAAEHSTIYGYGFVSAHVTTDLNELVSDSLNEHRERRDAAIAKLAGRSETPPIASVGYQLPFPVKNVNDAARLAVAMEETDAVAWRAMLEQAKSPEDRAFAVTAISQCAVRAAQWRHVLNIWPMTVALPGEGQ